MDCDEVVKGLYIGDRASASTIPFLRRQAITHVLNVAEGRDQGEQRILELKVSHVNIDSKC